MEKCTDKKYVIKTSYNNGYYRDYTCNSLKYAKVIARRRLISMCTNHIDIFIRGSSDIYLNRGHDTDYSEPLYVYDVDVDRPYSDNMLYYRCYDCIKIDEKRKNNKIYAPKYRLLF